MKKDIQLSNLVLTALMIAMVTVATILIRIPTPATSGYINLGDGMVFFAALLLGKKRGVLAAGLGSALGDLFSGYAFWAPWTFCIKALMALTFILCMEGLFKHEKSPLKVIGIPLRELFGMVCGGFVMVAGYYIAAAIIYGSWLTPIDSLLPNTLQFSVGIVVAIALSKALYKTPSRRYFAYRLDQLN